NTDDTQRIVGERQLGLLRDLAASTADARTAADACRRSAAALGGDRRDLPFALVYLVDAERQRLVLTGSSGIAAGHPAAPDTVDAAATTPWPFAAALRGQLPV